MNNFSIAVLISGGGTTLRNLIERLSDENDPLVTRISLVVSSNPSAKGLMFAIDGGIPTAIVDHRNFNTAESISNKVFELCRDQRIDLVVLGGFLRKLVIPDDFANRVINIHPSLIPNFCGKGFYGLRVHRAVIESGSAVTGCTVHFVDNQYDHGPIIAQRQVQVRDGDTPEILAARVFEQECALYPQVINALARGLVKVHVDQVMFDDNKVSWKDSKIV